MKSLLVCSLLLSFSSAQVGVRGEFGVATDYSLVSVDRTPEGRVGLTLQGRLEADYDHGPVELRSVLEPSVRLAGDGVEGALIEPGLTEAFARYRLGDLDLSAGVERLPLETARLSVPFRLETVTKTGQPSGLLGARATFFAGDRRVRPALVYRQKDDRLGGVLSVRQTFGRFEGEAHALYLDGLVMGLGGSGLVGDSVLYGEAWLMTRPWDGRGALGASGFWGELLWTVEAAYAPAPLAEGDAAHLQLLGRVSVPQGGAGNWDVSAGVGLVDGSVGGSSSLLYTHTEGDYQLGAGVSLGHTEAATTYGLRASLTTFF